MVWGAHWPLSLVFVLLLGSEPSLPIRPFPIKIAIDHCLLNRLEFKQIDFVTAFFECTTATCDSVTWFMMTEKLRSAS